MTTETDRELLEWAARAAGYEIVSDKWARVHSDEGETLFMGHHGPAWNPLTDDGDALRLAVKLDMTIDRVVMGIFIKGKGVAAIHIDREPESTRRAIVRAAAAIGKEMK